MEGYHRFFEMAWSTQTLPLIQENDLQEICHRLSFPGICNNSLLFVIPEITHVNMLNQSH
jgi:hypothetical protein